MSSASAPAPVAGSSTRSQPLLKPSKPSLPVPRIPTDNLICLIPWGTKINFLVPWCGVDFGGGIYRTDSVPWTAWLESWYQSFCPMLWDILDEDDGRDLQTLYALEACILANERHGGNQEELDRLEQDFKRLEKRRAERYLSFYVLHIVRYRWLLQHPTGEWDAAIAALEPSDPALLCPFPPESVWPVPTTHPTSPPCHCTTRLTLNTPQFEWARHVLPDLPSEHSRDVGLREIGVDLSTERGRAEFDSQVGEEKKPERRPRQQTSLGVVASAVAWVRGMGWAASF
ncbi:hypothetical protein JCM10213_008158 [Rhodosporidiobolus nylandii]